MRSEHILVTGGLGLFFASVVSCLYGDGWAWPRQQAVAMYSFQMALNMAATGDLAMLGAFVEQFGRDSVAGLSLYRLPWHLALAGALTVLPLWLMPRLQEVSERMKRLLALLLVGGGVLLGMGDLFQAAELANASYYALLAGYVWLALGLFGFLLYTVLLAWQQVDREQSRGKRC